MPEFAEKVLAKAHLILARAAKNYFIKKLFFAFFAPLRDIKASLREISPLISDKICCLTATGDSLSYPEIF